jgi:hypothetical protein
MVETGEHRVPVWTVNLHSSARQMTAVDIDQTGNVVMMTRRGDQLFDSDIACNWIGYFCEGRNQTTINGVFSIGFRERSGRFCRRLNCPEGCKMSE